MRIGHRGIDLNQVDGNPEVWFLGWRRADCKQGECCQIPAGGHNGRLFKCIALAACEAAAGYEPAPLAECMVDIHNLYFASW